MEDFKYYTLFGVRLSHGPDMKPKFSRDFLLRWTTNERQACNLAQAMIDNKMFPTTKIEAIKAAGLDQEAAGISGIILRMQFNPDISAHLFETEFPLEDQWVQILIDAANVGDFGREKLAEARVRL
jgi:hypothetical protein